MSKTDWKDSFKQDFKGIDPEATANRGYAAIYEKGWTSGRLSAVIRSAPFDAAAVPQRPTRQAVRTRDLTTSFDAAIARNKEHTRELYEMIMVALTRVGLTDEQLVGRIEGATPSGVRTRRAELVAAGWVVAAGTATLSTGRQGTVWAAVRDAELA